MTTMPLKSYFLLIVISLSNACSVENSGVSHTVNVPKEAVLQHLYYLSSDALKGRKIGTKGGKLAQNYIVSQLEQHNIAPLSENYFATFTIKNRFKYIRGKNVIGVIKGTKFPNRFIVLSAHFDHIGSKGRQIYNGADDNASGTSALLHYAKLIKQTPLRHSVIVLFTDGEEENLTGAKAFIRENTELLPDILLNINLDMLAGTGSTKKLHYISRGLKQVLTPDKIIALRQQNYAIPFKKGFRRQSHGAEKFIRWELASDHGAFYKQKIPFIYYGVGLHKHYHQTTDVYENINQTFFLLAVAAIYQQISFVDQNL